MSYVLLLCSHPLLCPTASRQTNGSHRRPSSWGLVAYWLLTQQPQLIYLHFEGKCKHAVKCALMFPLCTCIWDKQRFWINRAFFWPFLRAWLLAQCWLKVLTCTVERNVSGVMWTLVFYTYLCVDLHFESEQSQLSMCPYLWVNTVFEAR